MSHTCRAIGIHQTRCHVEASLGAGDQRLQLVTWIRKVNRSFSRARYSFWPNYFDPNYLIQTFQTYLRYHRWYIRTYVLIYVYMYVPWSKCTYICLCTWNTKRCVFIITKPKKLLTRGYHNTRKKWQYPPPSKWKIQAHPNPPSPIWCLSRHMLNYLSSKYQRFVSKAWDNTPT